MANRDKTCRAPDCDREMKARGLCGMHLKRALSGKHKGDHEYAKRFLLPTSLNPKPAPRVPRPARQNPIRVGPPPVPAPAASDAPQQAQRTSEDDQIALVCEFATVMGLKRVELPDGLMFLNEARKRQILLTDSAHLLPVEIRVGTAVKIGEDDEL